MPCVINAIYTSLKSTFRKAKIPSLTIWVCLHSFSCYCLRNTRNVAKLQDNLTLQQFKVIHGHRFWCQWKAHYYVTSYYSLIVTLAVSATVFEIFRFKDRKLLILPIPPLFDAPARGDPFEFCDEIWRQKNRIVGLQEGEEIMTLAFFVLTQYRRVTDRRTDTLLSQRPALA